MTHIDPALIEAAIPYFETRAKLAAMLKQAGVKKHAREYVAEVLLDAGVIDLDELAQLAPDNEEPAGAVGDELAAEWLDKPAWWNQLEGVIVATNGDDMTVQWMPPGGSPRWGRWLPVSWVTHEKPVDTDAGPDDVA